MLIKTVKLEQLSVIMVTKLLQKIVYFLDAHFVWLAIKCYT